MLQRKENRKSSNSSFTSNHLSFFCKSWDLKGHIVHSSTTSGSNSAQGTRSEDRNGTTNNGNGEESPHREQTDLPVAQMLEVGNSVHGDGSVLYGVLDLLIGDESLEVGASAARKIPSYTLEFADTGQIAFLLGGDQREGVGLAGDVVGEELKCVRLVQVLYEPRSLHRVQRIPACNERKLRQPINLPTTSQPFPLPYRNREAW